MAARDTMGIGICRASAWTASSRVVVGVALGIVNSCAVNGTTLWSASGVNAGGADALRVLGGRVRRRVARTRATGCSNARGLGSVRSLRSNARGLGSVRSLRDDDVGDMTGGPIEVRGTDTPDNSDETATTASGATRGASLSTVTITTASAWVEVNNSAVNGEVEGTGVTVSVGVALTVEVETGSLLAESTRRRWTDADRRRGSSCTTDGTVEMTSAPLLAV